MRSDREPRNANLDGSGEDVSGRCLLYLLGEMNDEQTAAFEAELSESPRLQAELISQSDILVGLSNAAPSLVVARATSSYGSWRLIMTMAAIAAGVMLAFLVWPAGQTRDRTIVVESTPESLLIAHAWAEGSLSATSISDLVSHSESYLDSEPGESFVGNDRELDDESSMSWIVSAVEAGAVSDG